MSETQPISHSPLEVVRTSEFVKNDPSANALLDIFEKSVGKEGITSGVDKIGRFRVKGKAINAPTDRAVLTILFNGQYYGYYINERIQTSSPDACFIQSIDRHDIKRYFKVDNFLFLGEKSRHWLNEQMQTLSKAFDEIPVETVKRSLEPFWARLREHNSRNQSVQSYSDTSQSEAGIIIRRPAPRYVRNHGGMGGRWTSNLREW
jgi:hypothetical protein